MKKELEQLYELHTTYNKHEDKPICKCGVIISLDFPFEELKKIYESSNASLQDFLEYFVKINNLWNSSGYLANILQKFYDEKNETDLLNFLKKKKEDFYVINQMAKIIDINKLYENGIITKETQKVVIQYWKQFRHKKDFLKRYSLDLSDLNKIFTDISLEDLKYIKLKKLSEHDLYITEINQNDIEKLHFIKEKFPKVKINYSSKSVIELLKEKRFSLLNLKDHSLWDLYILMFGKLIIEDKDLAPTEKDKKALEDIILEKDEKGFNGVSIKEDLYREDINTFLQQAILYKGEIYKIK